ncbi:MAG: aldehyde dehydrogenase family protein [Steroidobacteraceae bacterium]
MIFDTGAEDTLSAGSRCITFTGSSATSKSVMQAAAQSNLKRVSLQCGASPPT